MRRRRRAVGGVIAGIALVAAFITPVLAQGTSGVLVTDVDGPITPVIADHLAAAVDQAVGEAALLVVTLDTPGGLDSSMRDIVQTFLNASVPILVYVEPEGARAASAGPS